MRIEGLLPIGSVVILKEARHRMMIIGYCQKKLDQKEKIFDYVGCLYPEGYISADQCYLFNCEQIDKVYHVGYQTDGQFAFVEKVSDAIRTLRADEKEKT